MTFGHYDSRGNWLDTSLPNMYVDDGDLLINGDVVGNAVMVIRENINYLNR